MFNVKKGVGLTLAQSDVARPLTASTPGYVLAGMLCRVITAGTISLGLTGASTYGVGDLVGFAINNYTDGDVIESGKLGLFMLDGGSVVETDKVTGTINATNYPIGAALSGGTDGNVALASSINSGTNKIIGWVEGIRTLPSTDAITQSWVNRDGVTLSKTSTEQKFVSVLGIKLNA